MSGALLCCVNWFIPVTKEIWKVTSFPFQNIAEMEVWEVPTFPSIAIKEIWGKPLLAPWVNDLDNKWETEMSIHVSSDLLL